MQARRIRRRLWVVCTRISRASLQCFPWEQAISNRAKVSAALTMPTAKAPPHPTVTSNLRQGFYQAVKNLAGKHRAEAFAKYPSFAPIQNPKLIQNPKE